MDELLAWKHLSGSDEKLADRALAVLQHRYLPALHGFLSHAGMENRADRDDIISVGYLKLWVARTRINCPNERAGRSYLFTIVRRCMIDHVRTYAEARPVTIDALVGTEEELTATDSPDSQVYSKILMTELVDAANCLWLGLDSSLLPATHRRQLLAATYYYLENVPLDEILDILKAQPPAGEPKLTVPLLERWINHAGVLRFLAFQQLCYESTKLLTIILGVPELTPGQISDLWDEAKTSTPDEKAFAGLSWGGVAVAIMRYAYLVSMEDVASARHEVIRQWGYNQQQLLTLLETLRRRLPFCHDIELLLELIEYRTELEEVKQPMEVLGAPILWKRLSFQYSYLMELAHKDILERYQPPARVAGFTLTDNTLNSWVGGKRLQRRFLQYWKERYGEEPKND